MTTNGGDTEDRILAEIAEWLESGQPALIDSRQLIERLHYPRAVVDGWLRAYERQGLLILEPGFGDEPVSVRDLTPLGWRRIEEYRSGR